MTAPPLSGGIPARPVVTVGDTPTRRHRFTIAHELGHWICHAHDSTEPVATYCRSQDLSQDTGRALEREANVFGAELLMTEPAVRRAWTAFPDASGFAECFEEAATYISQHWAGQAAATPA